MFTGIIEEVGVVRHIKKAANSSVIDIKASKIIKELEIGDSVAVNGICLTVVKITDDGFCADVMPETVAVTNLRQLHGGALVNLERAMAASSRFGGHIVTGHIDGCGIITNITQKENAVLFTIRADETILRYIIKKGSVALSGISLTIAKISDNDFTVSIIPHSLQNTILGSCRIGDILNIENDCIGKYVEKLLNNSCRNETKAFSYEFMKQYN